MTGSFRFVVCAVLFLSLFGGSHAWGEGGAQIMPLSSALDLTRSQAPNNCKNYKWKSCTYHQCCTMPDGTQTSCNIKTFGYWVPIDDTSNCPAAQEGWSYQGSQIDNISFNHLHQAIDYSPPEPPAGCSSCGTGGCGTGSSPEDMLPTLGLMRVHRFRDITEQGSFGPGVFSNYDVNLRLETQGTWRVAQLFDANHPFPIRLFDGRSNPHDGVYLDVITNSITDMTLYDGADGTGDVTSSRAQAVSAVLRSRKGNRFVFELFGAESYADPGSTGLQAKWKLDDGSGTVAADASGNSHTGTLVGGPAWSDDVPSSATTTGSLDFDGTDDKVEVPNDPTLNPAGSFSVSAWAKVEGSDGTVRTVISSRDSVYSGGTYTLRGYMIYANASNNWHFMLGDGSAWNSATGDVVATDRWTHVVATFEQTGTDGDVLTGTSCLYVNGELVATRTTARYVPQANGYPLRIGTGANESSTGNFRFNGKIADVRVYSRLLSAEEISAMCPPQQCGRLTRIEDRNGHGVDIAYKTWTPEQLEESPDRQWQMDTVTDAYGRQMAFSYHTEQVGGRWAVSQIDLPNSQSLQYTYADAKLSQVTHPDGGVSSFAWVRMPGPDSPRLPTRRRRRKEPIDVKRSI